MQGGTPTVEMPATSLATPYPEVRHLIKMGAYVYKDVFNALPKLAAVGPGRVNLIGEHTDYNEGFVLPVALPLVTVMVGSANNSDECVVKTVSPDVCEEDRVVRFKVPSVEPLVPGDVHWANYVMGSVANFKGTPIGFNAIIISSVPSGGGLSSSAALEVATYTFLEALTGKPTLDLTVKASACQKAEHEFAGVPCGIMDQYIAILGRENYALLLDCRNNEVMQVQFKDSSVKILVTDSGVKHSLGESEYPKRRAECEHAAAYFSKPSLRDVSTSELEAVADTMSDDVYKRARHVVKENIRTFQAAKALNSKDYNSFGLLMTQSHYSLKDDFAVSCPEVDNLVEITMECEGVYGSRMTGGGFGGCTVTLVKKDFVESTMQEIKAKYLGEPKFYVVSPSEGTKYYNLMEPLPHDEAISIGSNAS